MRLWVLFSILAMAGNVVKVIVVNRCLQNIDSRIVVLIARFTFAALLVPVCVVINGHLPSDPVFWCIVFTTSALTTVASVMFVEAVKNGRLAVVMPMQSAIPMFTVLAGAIMYREFPRAESLLFIVLSMCALAWTLYFSSLKKQKRTSGLGPKWALYSLFAAWVFGAGLVFDKAAILRVEQNGWLAYSAGWSLVSLFMIGGDTLRHKPKLNFKIINASGIILAVYSALVISVFCLQQLALQYSMDVTAAAVSIKSIVILYLCIVVLIDYFLFRDKVSWKVLAGAFAAIVSAIALMRTMM